ncbi:hypothetical protein RAJCM14343_1981 [Rhodococcus aetherivorans]|uniref:Uncharacterized protein n=1 Tax=Rhodococcus aetherivorans TaxID=191292 RepID=A0ABQ0YJR5_9NOCA|nr:hypothetical protein RAJCM14343_1981 [Rhodococcus aetherivorans]
MTHRVPMDALGAGAAGIDGGIDGQNGYPREETVATRR